VEKKEFRRRKWKVLKVSFPRVKNSREWGDAEEWDMTFCGRIQKKLPRKFGKRVYE